jgi:hypothetical protein
MENCFGFLPDLFAFAALGRNVRAQRHRLSTGELRHSKARTVFSVTIRGMARMLAKRSDEVARAVEADCIRDVLHAQSRIDEQLLREPYSFLADPDEYRDAKVAAENLR